MAARRRRSTGDGQNGAERPSSQERKETLEELQRLRAQLGTAELARRMGVPAPSLRRMLGKGKSAGLPHDWSRVRNVHVRSKLASEPDPKRARNRLHRRVRRMIEEGSLDAEYADVADDFGINPSEVYSMGMSPVKFGISL